MPHNERRHRSLLRVAQEDKQGQITDLIQKTEGGHGPDGHTLVGATAGEGSPPSQWLRRQRKSW